MNDLVAMVVVLVAAWFVAHQASRPSHRAAAARLQRLERRLSEIEATLGQGTGTARGDREVVPVGPEAPGQLDKRYAAFHYEALASQAAYERKLEALEWRVASMGLERHAARGARCTNRQGATTGDRGHG